MKALKLKLVPTKKQYKLLDEMFWKWASLANRVSQKGKSKETLSPNDKIQKIQFNATQLNQIEKDVKDLKGAMEEQGKQKRRLLTQIQERLSTFDEILRDDSKREKDPHKPSNFKPVGWRKFHTSKYWAGEVKKLTRQKERIEKTINKIEAGKINFKPKRIGLWAGMYEINFLKKKIKINPFIPKGFYLDLVMEPEQKQIGKNNGKSVIKSREYLNNSIKSLLIFAIHSQFFGLNNSDKYLLGGKITPQLIKYYKKNQDIENFKKEVIERFERKLKQEISEKQKKIIFSQINLQYSQRDTPFNKEYLNVISEISEVFNQRKDARAEYLLSLFEGKIKLFKKYVGEKISPLDWDFLFEEAKKAYIYEKGFTEYIYSARYAEILEKIAENILIKDSYFDLKKYPILLRKSADKTKKIGNLKPNEWKYYIQFGYEPINAISFLDTRNFLGIDRGLTHLLAYSIFDKGERKFIVNQLEPNPIKGWKWKLRKVKRSLQHLERKWKAKENVKLPENQMKKKLRSIEPKVEVYYHNKNFRI